MVFSTFVQPQHKKIAMGQRHGNCQMTALLLGILISFTDINCDCPMGIWVTVMAALSQC